MTTVLHRSSAEHRPLVAPDRAAPQVRSPPSPVLVWTCTWETGPDAGGRFDLGEGRTIVGRAPTAGVRCDDPALQPHHALFVVAGDEVRLLQLTGRAPLLVDGQPVDRPVQILGHAVVELGQSALRIGRRPATDPPTADIRDGAVLRAPRHLPRWEPAPLTPPSDRPDRTDVPAGLVPALCGAAAAVVLAVVLGQWLILAIGLLGAAVAVGGWVAQRIGLVRRRRRTSRSVAREWAAHAAALAELGAAYGQHLVATSSTAATALATITRRDHRLWSRRADDADVHTVSLGIGEIVWRPPLADSAAPGEPTLHIARHPDRLPPPVGPDVLRDLPIAVTLAGGARLALCGGRLWTLCVARSIVVQLAANCGPADVRLVAVTEHPERWSWMAGLPHASAPDGTCSITDSAGLSAQLASLEQAGAPHIVVVTDAPELLAARTAPLRRAIGSDRPPALIAIVADDEPIPTVCTAVLQCPSSTTGSGVWARWTADRDRDDVPAAVRVAGVGLAAASRAVHRLHGLVDPDDALGAGSVLPSTVSLSTLLQADGRPLNVAGILARWRIADAHPRTPIGVATDGIVELDLVRDGPHALIAGTTGSGKSELLRSLVAGMAIHAPPEQLTFVLVDYKGGATFDACAELPHVVGLVTDLDEHLGERMLRSLHAELRRREAVLRAHAVTDLAELHHVTNADDGGPVLARLVVVIDEFAALVAEQPTFLHALVGVAQRGRSLGVHLVLATQRPGGVLSDDIRANTNVRCALRLTDTADALDVIGDTSPVSIGRRLPGRAVLRLGPDEHITFQSACCTANESGPSELALLARAMQDAHRRSGAAAPPLPWCPPLPAELSADDPRLEPDSGDDGDGGSRAIVGLVDEPDRQRQLPLRWTAGGGHHLIGGGRASGVTSTLLTLADAAIAATPATHLYVVDADGDERCAALAEHPACAGVVRLHEAERLRRLLLRLGAEIEHRSGDGTDERHGDVANTSRPPIVLLVDGYTELRDHLADIDTEPEREALDRVLAHGARCGIVAVLAVGQPSAVPPSVLARCDRRWLLHVVDGHDALGWGWRTGDVPPPVAGRVSIAPGLQAQLIRPGCRPLTTEVTGDRPAPIEVLPPDVRVTSLGRGRTHHAGVVLPLGLSFDTGAPADVEVADGEHLLVLGPARSGRTTALRRLADAWGEAHPTGWHALLAGRTRSTERHSTHPDLGALLADLPAAGPALIAVDDAELVVDDPAAASTAALAALIASRRPGLLVVAAGSADALRQTYGHWTGVIRRSRLGLVLSAAGELDGDLLGAHLPRRRPVPARPGLAWLVAHGEARLVQIARDPPSHAGTPPVA